MTCRTLAHGETTIRTHPFIHHPSESDWICLHIWVYCVHHVMCLSLHPSASHRDTAESQPLSPSMLCYRRAAIYNNQLISQRVAPDSQQLLHWRTQILPSYSHTQTHWYIWADGGTVEEERRRKNIFLFVPFFPDMCCSGSPGVIGRLQADKALSDRRSPLWTLPLWKETRLVQVLLLSSLSPPSERVK